MQLDNQQIYALRVLLDYLHKESFPASKMCIETYQTMLVVRLNGPVNFVRIEFDEDGSTFFRTRYTYQEYDDPVIVSGNEPSPSMLRRLAQVAGRETND